MKSILIAGLGRFGTQLAKKFHELGDEVMVIDRSEEFVQAALPFADEAQVGDCRKEEVLRSLGVEDFDVCFVCMGEEFQSSLEVTLLLKELGAKHVVSKCGSEIQEKFLLRNGADEVWNPERELAAKLAVRYSANNLYDYFSICEDAGVYEMPILRTWTGKTLAELDMRNVYGLNILGIKDADGRVQTMPGAKYIFKENDHIIAFARHDTAQKLLKKI
ncbi:MAG: TrkA family potassium uptake protein [Ruminococcaceae bacterium]|nr:TrkA family potassium uptake protein [Oscillospiraceae bacterium]